MESVAKRGLFHMRTEAMEWLMPDSEEALAPPDVCVMSFTPFHERRLMTPPDRLL
jgi:hypothetical protein